MPHQFDARQLVERQFFAPEAKFNVLGGISDVIEKGRTDAAAREQQQLFAQGGQAAFEGTATPQQISELFAANPERAKQVLEGAGAFNDTARQQVADTAFRIQSAPFNQRAGMIQQAAQQVQRAGGDPNRILSLLNMGEAQQNEQLDVFQQAALTVQQRAAGDIAQQELGLSERRVAATERNVASQIADRQRTQARLAQKATDAANAGIQIDAKGRRSINGDVTGLIKESVAIQASAKSLEGLEKLGSAASRLAAVFKFMKALDPTSVVRETEQGQVYAASGAASQLAGQLNSILGKGKLTDPGFKDLVATSKNIANSSLTSTRGSVNSYLETYEDTLPSSFKTRLTARVPDLFEVSAPQQAAPETTGTAEVAPATAAAPITVGRFQVRTIN